MASRSDTVSDENVSRFLHFSKYAKGESGTGRRYEAYMPKDDNECISIWYTDGMTEEEIWECDEPRTNGDKTINARWRGILSVRDVEALGFNVERDDKPKDGHGHICNFVSREMKNSEFAKELEAIATVKARPPHLMPA